MLLTNATSGESHMVAKGKRLLVLGVPLSTLIGIIACFGDDAVGASINPALASIALAFPDIPYSQILWLYSMPKMAIVPITLIAGLITGKYVSFRTAAITGFALIAIGGVMPVFMDDFWAVLGSRFILGIGLGIQAPIGPALVLRYFSDPQKRATVLGFGHGFVNIYGVFTNLLVGSLAVVNWRYSFLAYGTIFILLAIAILWVREPEDGRGSAKLSANQIIAAQTREDKLKESIEGMPGESSAITTGEIESPSSQERGIWKRMPKKAYGLVAAYLVALVLWGVAGLNLSAIVQSSGFGDSVTSGAVVSLINLSGVISGFAFGLLTKRMRGYVLPFGMFLMAAGFAVYYVAPNVYVLAVGVFVGGLANTIIMTGFESAVGSCCDASLISLGMSLCMVVSQLSGFLCPFYIGFVMDVLGFSSYTAPLMVSAVLLAVMGIAFAFVTFAARKRARVASLQR